MNCNDLKNIIYNIVLELNKTDVKCYDTEIIIFSPNHAQVLFLLRKNNKKYYVLENIYFNDDEYSIVKLITENILLNMKYK